jgi:hypothetical protein
MKRRLIAATIAAIIVASAAPANAGEVTGKVRSVNQIANTATLDNGDTFFLANAIDVTDLQVGDQVKITYRGVGASKRAISVKHLNR